MWVGECARDVDSMGSNAHGQGGREHASWEAALACVVVLLLLLSRLEERSQPRVEEARQLRAQVAARDHEGAMQPAGAAVCDSTTLAASRAPRLRAWVLPAMKHTWLHSRPYPRQLHIYEADGRLETTLPPAAESSLA